MTNLTPILDRIARLKNLADKPGTPEEAAAALSAIQRLMTRYNLSEQQVHGASLNDARGYAATSYNLGGNNGWRAQLMNGIAKYTFCQAIFAHAGSGVNIVGEEHNVAAVIGMYEYLVGAINRLADEGWKAYGMKGYTTTRRWKNAFRVGAVGAVLERLREQYEEHLASVKADEPGAGALVLVKDDALAKAVRELFPNTRRSSAAAGYSDRAGRMAGHEAGGRINLAAQIGGGR